VSYNRQVSALVLGLLLGLAPASAAPASAAPAAVAPRLAAALGERGSRPQLVWVFFSDKGARPESRLAEAHAWISPRALSRRALRGRTRGLATLDLPLVRPYVDTVAAGVLRVRQESRWFNAVSVEATAEQVEALARLPFVERLDLVARYRRSREEPIGERAASSSAVRGAEPHALDYGTSLGQVAQINVPAVHDLGLHGEGTVIALFDAGFNNLAHEAFAPMTILAAHDFVNGDDDVGDGSDMGEGSHGTATLSTIGGYRPGELIGPAFAASFVLAKTENTASETPVEEDNWAAAAEWAEALGADVISSSLGYLDFDRPFTSYTFADMNGQTAISTRAADLAASLGVVVVNSAGNSGFDAVHNTLGAPADGRAVISVGAVDFAGRRASFSSVGPTADGRIKPDVVAQGVSVKVARSSSTTGYTGSSGTSFSCPLTAGVAALVLQAHPFYSVEQVISVMRETASNAGSPDNLVGWGIVNALAAVQAPAP
jgi:subtilisin family serine protease